MYFQAYVSKLNAPRAANQKKKEDTRVSSAAEPLKSHFIRPNKEGWGGLQSWQKYVPGPGLPKKTYKYE